MLVGCQVFGRRAGIDAAARAAGRAELAPSASVVDAAIARATGIARRAGGGNVSPDDLRSELQAAMSESMLVGRSAAGMERCLEHIAAIRARLRDACVGGPSGLAGVIELDNLLTVGEMMVRTAIWRTESRGSHYRTDCPTADVAWSKSIVVRRADHGMKLTTAVLPRLDGCSTG
jgi:succinate dehydrogenase/fumarate reductase flavoprotein subunit